VTELLVILSIPASIAAMATIFVLTVGLASDAEAAVVPDLLPGEGR
jgi:hypothetical protein